MNGNNLFGVLINTNGSFIKTFKTLEEAKIEIKTNEYAEKVIIYCVDYKKD